MSIDCYYRKYNVLSFSSVAYPKTHGEMIKADYQQKLVIRFLLKDSANKAARVHQAFVRLTWVDAKPGEDNGVIFVAEPDASHVYKFDMVNFLSRALVDKDNNKCFFIIARGS